MNTCFRKSTASILSIILLGVFSQCDESLPPRTDPLQFFSVSFESIPGPVTMKGGEPQGGNGGFRFTMKNLHDEVLQGDARVQGIIDVWMKDHPTRRTRAIFTSKEIVNGTQYAGFITIGVDSSLILQGQWSHVTTSDAPFWQFVNLTQAFTNAGTPFCRSDPVQLVAQASFQIFKNVQPIRMRIEFSMVYNVFDTTCPPN